MQFNLQKSDLSALESLIDLIPDRIFDAHLHVSFFEKSPYGIADFLQVQKALFPSVKTVRGNAIIMPLASLEDPTSGLRDQSMLRLKEELDAHLDFVGEALVLPDDSLADIERLLIHKNIRGLKCYHLYAKNKPTWNADMEEYLPESAWQAADLHGLCITLHLVKDRSLADPANLHYIRRMAQRYPRATLILAHCGRAFATWTVMENAEKVRDLPNVYFDISSICEAPAIFACIRGVGIDRVLWGSDFPISANRGKVVSISTGSLWLYEEQIRQLLGSTEQPIDLIAVEELRALAQASSMLSLSRNDLSDLFYNNAQHLFG